MLRIYYNYNVYAIIKYTKAKIKLTFYAVVLQEAFTYLNKE